MTANEQLWFTIGIGGFLLVLEGAVAFTGRTIFKNVSPDVLKVIAGILIYILAIVVLFNLP